MRSTEPDPAAELYPLMPLTAGATMSAHPTSPGFRGGHLFRFADRRLQDAHSGADQQLAVRPIDQLLSRASSATAILDRFLHHADVVVLSGRVLSAPRGSQSPATRQPEPAPSVTHRGGTDHPHDHRHEGGEFSWPTPEKLRAHCERSPSAVAHLTPRQPAVWICFAHDS